MIISLARLTASPSLIMKLSFDIASKSAGTNGVQEMDLKSPEPLLVYVVWEKIWPAASSINRLVIIVLIMANCFNGKQIFSLSG